RRIVCKYRLEPSNPIGSLTSFAIRDAFEIRPKGLAYIHENVTRVAKWHAADKVDVTHRGSVEMKFFELSMFGQNSPDRSCHRTHYDGFGFNNVLTEFHTAEHVAGRNSGRREQTITSHHILDLVFFLRILDSHFQGALTQLLSIDDQPRLHLSADTTQSRGG